jgi:hypothetical protein
MSKAKAIKILPPVELLREYLDYDPETGWLIWKPRARHRFATYKGWAVWNANNAGARAGNVKGTGHRRVLIEKSSYQEHRVIYKWMTGEEPPETLDHKHGDGDNNRWVNLRPASHLQQKWNMRIRNDNKSGFRGVHPSGTRWSARISIDGRYQHIGCFGTAEDAAAAYEAIARGFQGEFYLPDGDRK